MKITEALQRMNNRHAPVSLSIYSNHPDQIMFEKQIDDKLNTPIFSLLCILFSLSMI